MQFWKHEFFFLIFFYLSSMALSYSMRHSKNILFLVLYIGHTTQRPITAVDNLRSLQLQEIRVVANKCQLLASRLCGRGADCVSLWDVGSSYFTIANQKNTKSSSPKISKQYPFLKFHSFQFSLSKILQQFNYILYEHIYKNHVPNHHKTKWVGNGIKL